MQFLSYLCSMKKNPFVQILTWLAIMAVLTLLAMGIWLIALGGSQTTAGLKWLQLLQTMGTFLLPPVICAAIWSDDHKPFRWLHLDTKPDGLLCFIAITIMICAVPAINLLADLNSRISLPDSLAALEHQLRAMEEAAAALTERFLQTDSFGGLLINIGLMALLPAFAEELSFRGTLQQVLSNSPKDGLTAERSNSVSGLTAKRSIAVWLTAIIFSAIHMQFFGFIPRMLMGAMFGYAFLWSGSLWIPILMHFTNNSLAVIAFYCFGQNSSADTIGTGATWWLGVLSLVLTSLGLLIFYRRTHKE